MSWSLLCVRIYAEYKTLSIETKILYLPLKRNLLIWLMLLTRCLQTTTKYHSVNDLKSEIWKHLSSSQWVSAQCFPSPLISGTPMSVHGRIEVISAKATYEFKLLLVCANQLRCFILWGIAKVESNCGWVMLISCSLTCIFLPGYSHFRCLKAVSA